MKSSSNLITGSATAEQPNAWNPVDFGGEVALTVDAPAETDVPETAADPLAFEGLFVPTVQLKERPVIQESQPHPSDFPEESDPADETDHVRRWMPNEVHQVIIPGDNKVMVRTSNGPSLDEIRYKLIQETMKEAGQVLADTQVKAAEIILKAQESAAQIIQNAQQQGWDQAQRETEPMLSAVQQMVQQVQSWSDDLYASSQEIIFGLVQEIARTLFFEGMTLDADMLQKTFSRILNNARSLGDLRIYVNPDDAINLGPYWREYQVAVSGQQIEIIPSDSITRGGCLIDGQLGTVDGRIETQYKAIMDVLSTSMEKQEA